MTPREITTLAGHRLLPPWVMKLALEVAAAEREACAKVCDDLISKGYQLEGELDLCAAAIRARREK